MNLTIVSLTTLLILFLASVIYAVRRWSSIRTLPGGGKLYDMRRNPTGGDIPFVMQVGDDMIVTNLKDRPDMKDGKQ